MQRTGLRQCDIPKMKGFIESGKTAEEIANGMLGYIAPVNTIRSFFPSEKKAATKDK